MTEFLRSMLFAVLWLSVWVPLIPFLIIGTVAQEVMKAANPRWEPWAKVD